MAPNDSPRTASSMSNNSNSRKGGNISNWFKRTGEHLLTYCVWDVALLSPGTIQYAHCGSTATARLPATRVGSKTNSNGSTSSSIESHSSNNLLARPMLRSKSPSRDIKATCKVKGVLITFPVGMNCCLQY